MSLWSPVDLVSGGTGKTNANLTNNTINSPQFRSAKREDKCAQSYTTSSLLYDHLLRRSSSKFSDNNNVITKDLNSAINRVVMTSNETSLQILNSKKRSTIKRLVDLSLVSQTTGDRTSRTSIEQAIPLLKPKTSDEVNENCDKKYKNFRNSNTIMSNNEEEDCVMPLDLCVKKSKDESDNSVISANRKSSIFAKSGSTASHIHNTHHNQSTTITTINTPQYNPSSHSSRKRGRKPKSLLATATASNLMIPSNLAAISNFIDTKPRKRGRPPTLSPPLCAAQTQQPLAAHSSNLNKALSSSGAFQSHFPYAVLNTPLQPGWPSLSSTGQLIFPDKLNGNEINSYKLNKTSANVSESSDNLESIASDSESNDESNSDSGSQTSQTSGNKTSDSHERDSYAHLLGKTVNENAFRIPLQLGWRRETKITKFSRSGVEGEVVYYSPCARKMRNISEIIKYLTKNGTKNIMKEYFSFDPKLIVGNFVQKIPNSGTEILLGEKEIRKQLEVIKRSTSSSRPDKKRKSSNDSMVSEEIRLKNLMERTRALIPRDAKRAKLEELKKLRENDIHLKEEERLEFMRLEKVAKIQQIEEIRRKRREEMETQRQEEMVRKVQEREVKRQQLELMREQEMQRRRELLIMADLERERRRQHMVLVRALETHKKQEEKERKKEEILAERMRIQEKKFQKKRLEMELLRELKKPVDDMMWKDLEALPTLNRIPGLKLTGKAFADTLMVFEFLHNFGETLGFDMESLPTLNTLTLALLNIEESAEEELLSVIHHLLVCAIEDPGIPTNITTIMGQKLKDAPITNYNITEILRLYFISFDNNIRDEWKEHRIESRMVRILENGCPFLALNAEQKAEILAFLCDELLCNQTIVKQIEENIETVSYIRRDKWVHENELRKWKTIKANREKKLTETEDNKKNDLETNEDESGDSDAEEAQNGSITVATNDSEDEPTLTNEEIDKKIDKLNKQFNQMNNKLNKATNMYRVCSLGQDRYRRRYWVLPNAGGVFVEGIESGEPEERENNVWTEEEEKESALKVEETAEENNESTDDNKDLESSKELSEEIETKDNESQENNENIKEEIDIKQNVSLEDTKTDEESDEIKDELIDKNEETNETKSSSEPNDKSVEQKSDSKSHLKTESKSVSKTDSIKDLKKEKQSDETIASDIQSSVPNDSQWMSPFFASVLAGSLILNNNGTSGANASSNGLSASQLPLSFPFGLDLANNGNSSSTSKANQSNKTWFSVLPRMPCDESVSESEFLEDIKPEVRHNSKANKKSEKLNESIASTQQKLLQQSPLSSLMNGLPSNLFMQAFLYPHILSSLFNQNSLGGGPCPPDTSPFSFGSSPSTKAVLNQRSSSSQSSDPNTCEQQETTKQAINPTNCDPLVDSEVDICPSLQKRIAQQKEQQFERPQKIRNEYQFGWWRITDSSQLKIMIEVLNGKGVRERQLQKHLIKYLNYASQSCKSNVAELEITEMDRQIAEKCAFGAPNEGKCPHEICVDSDWCKEVALRFDIAVLEQIEGLEEKIATSSMQIRNWKPMPRISSDETMRFSPSAAFIERRKLSETEKLDTNSDDIKNCSENTSEDIESHSQSSDSESGEINPVNVARDRLLALEAVIERRYLKPPLGFKSNTILISTNSSEVGQSDDYNDNAADENATTGLLRWRDAVREANCSAEIALCLHFLESCIAWDKSIMRASCQFCGSGENEAQLLLCDGCDKGYHTYCFKPKMDTIPDGDWFCFECQNKNTIDKVCVVCGKKGKLLNCDSCVKVFHPNCLDPPVTKPLKGKWICHMCGRKPKKPNLQKSSKKSHNTSSEEKLIETINNTSTAVNNSTINTPKESSKRLSNGTNKVEKETKKEKKLKQSEKSCEINNCKTILDHMESHEDSWPFLLPVNTKQFPTYKKIIKKPMDTTTIRAKLDSSGYKNKEEFSADVRLIFDNCVTFNEDESPVGQAGHTLRAFFETKWKELFGS